MYEMLKYYIIILNMNILIDIFSKHLIYFIFEIENAHQWNAHLFQKGGNFCLQKTGLVVAFINYHACTYQEMQINDNENPWKV